VVGGARPARRPTLDVPVVLVTADRKPGHSVRARHDALAAALGGRIESWPGCVHAMQLRDPDKTNAIVQRVLAEAVDGASDRS
jgi:pimeloyl-ACP methyl ester carboxylesterase